MEFDEKFLDPLGVIGQCGGGHFILCICRRRLVVSIEEAEQPGYEARRLLWILAPGGRLGRWTSGAGVMRGGSIVKR